MHRDFHFGHSRFRMTTRVSRWLALVAAVLFITLQLSVARPVKQKVTMTTRQEFPHYNNTALGVGYVSSKTCGRCHVSVYKSYVNTDMGQSVSLPNSPEQLAITSKPVTVRVKKSNRYYQVFRRGSSLYQSEYELGPDGKAIFRITHRIHYVIGAGMNGFTYVIRRGNYLFEAPLSFYTRTESWGLSPGYKHSDYGFNRPIHTACIACHSGLPQPVPQRNGLFRNPPFRQMAVGCEDCHGPGELHVKAMLAGKLPSGKIDPNIVNPANLPGWMADNVCMRCHQGGDARVLLPEKHYEDFRPGMPLENTVAIFALPFKPQLPPQSPLLQHYELMIMSKCYRASGGKLHCITCHNPHVQPSASEAPAYYRKKCFLCHTDKSCSLPIKTRLRQHPPDDCIACHMPKEKVLFVSHSALTNHRIIAYEGEPWPKAAYHQTTEQLPDLINLDAIPGNKTPLTPIVLLQAYGQLLVQHPQFITKYLMLLMQLERTEPDNPIVLSAVARQRLSIGETSAAQRDLARAIKLGSTEPSDYELYANALAEGGNLEGAIAVLKQGIALDPYYRRFYKDLALRYISTKKYDEALQTIKQELALFPGDSFMRKVLSMAERRSAAH